MTTILIALGALLVGAAGATLIGRCWFLEGLQLGRDDRALEPGGTGSLEAVAEATEVLRPVGESSGRHAAIDWPTDAEQTQTIPAVPAEVYAFGGIVRPEVRA